MLYITCRPTTRVFMCILLTKSMFFEVFTYIFLYHLIHHFRVFFYSPFRSELPERTIYFLCLYVDDFTKHENTLRNIRNVSSII